MSDPVTPHRPGESTPKEPSGDSGAPPDEGRRKFSDVVDFLIESTRRTTAASAQTRRASAVPSRSISLELLLLAVVIVAVTTLGAYFVSARGTRVYGARAEFLVQNDRFASDSAINRQIQTQSVLILSRAVLDQVATNLGIETTDLEKIATAEIIGESQVLRLLVADPDPDTAREIASAIAGEYLETASDLTRSLGGERSAPEVDLVTGPYGLEEPLQPDPMQGAAAGALGGLVIAGGVIFVVTQRRKR
jgi:capsular polysaccharide biosynthesis protein